MFKYAALPAWNRLQNDLNLMERVTLDEFKVILNYLEANLAADVLTDLYTACLNPRGDDLW